MKSSDIKVGDVIRLNATNGYGRRLVIAIGRYNYARVNGLHHTVSFLGITVNVKNHWILDSTNAKTRVYSIPFDADRDGQNVDIQDHDARSIDMILPPETLKELFINERGKNMVYEITAKARAREEEYNRAMAECLQQITGLPISYNHWTPTYQQLSAHAEFMDKLILLWLQYHAKSGIPVNGEEDVETLLGNFKDIVVGLRGVGKAADERVAQVAEVIQQQADAVDFAAINVVIAKKEKEVAA